MILLGMDFETYYDDVYSLKNMTTQQYILDQRFEAIGCAVVTESSRGFVPGPMLPQFFEAIPWKQVAVVSYNSKFDMGILALRYGKHPGFVFDAMSMAVAKLKPQTGRLSLANVAKTLSLPAKGTEVHNAKGKRFADFTPDELERYGAYSVHDAWLAKEIMRLLLVDFPREELDLIDLTVRMFTRPTILLDRPRLVHYHGMIQQRKADALVRARVPKDVLMSNDKLAAFLSLLLDDEPPTKTSLKTGKKAWAFSKRDREFKALLDHDNPLVREVVSARLEVKSTIEETRAARLIDLAPLGPLCVPLNYCGAHTTRYSGGDKLNLQNLPRFDPRKPEKGELRGSLVAPSRYVILAADASQIEARVLAWLAGCWQLVKLFAEGADVYSWFATQVFKFEVNKKDYPVQRHLGKTSVLGLGYGMGWNKFWYELLLDEVLAAASLATADVAILLVNTYRGLFPEVPKLWNRASMILSQMKHMQGGYQFGPCVVTRDRVWLPNGLAIEYRDLHWELDEARGDSDKGQWFYYYGGMKKKIYGAKMVENIVQALARCILTEAMLKASKYMQIALTVHDEIVAVVHEQDAKDAKDYLVQLIGTAPTWAAGCPLAAEGGYGLNYLEAK